MRTGIAAIVVQLGLAMMPRPASMTAAIASGLTSETTSGISGSMRKAEELSTTITPASANFGTSARDVVAPAENSAMSSPAGSAVSASSTVISRSPNGSTVPAERAEAKKRTCVGREVALEQDLAHRDADLAGGADDAEVDLRAHRPVPP